MLDNHLISCLLLAAAVSASALDVASRDTLRASPSQPRGGEEDWLRRTDAPSPRPLARSGNPPTPARFGADAGAQCRRRLVDLGGPGPHPRFKAGGAAAPHRKIQVTQCWRLVSFRRARRSDQADMYSGSGAERPEERWLGQGLTQAADKCNQP